MCLVFGLFNKFVTGAKIDKSIANVMYNGYLIWQLAGVYLNTRVLQVSCFFVTSSVSLEICRSIKNSVYIVLLHNNFYFFCFFVLVINSYVLWSLLFFTYMICSSILLLKGLKNNLRGFLLPWLIGMGVVVLFLLVWSIWLLYGYYIYVSIS